MDNNPSIAVLSVLILAFYLPCTSSAEYYLKCMAFEKRTYDLGRFYSVHRKKTS